MLTNFYLKDNDWFNKLNIASMFLNVILKVHLWLNSSEWLARAPRMLEIEWPTIPHWNCSEVQIQFRNEKLVSAKIDFTVEFESKGLVQRTNEKFGYLFSLFLTTTGPDLKANTSSTHFRKYHLILNVGFICID